MTNLPLLGGQKVANEKSKLREQALLNNRAFFVV